MVSKGEVAPEENAVTVRSVLLRRDWPGPGGCPPRRQRHPQQVRFKDLEEGGTCQETPVHNTLRASMTPKRQGANSARRSWPQAEPRMVPREPSPPKGCASTAIQTSPALQAPPWAAPLCSKSACDFAHQGGLGQGLPPWGGAISQPSASSLAQLCPKTCATLCPVRPPPPRCPCPPYPGWGPCLPASSPTQPEPCACSPCPPYSPVASWLGPTPCQGSPPPYPIAHGSFQRDPPLASHLLLNTSSQGVAPRSPHTTSSPSATSEESPPAAAAAAASPVCLGTTQVARPAPCPPPGTGQPSSPGPGGLLPPRAPGHSRRSGGCLSSKQAEALRQVQGLLQLVPLGRGLAEEEEEAEHPQASWEPPCVAADVQSRLQSLEGVLETSQQTIHVLLRVIQDLERKEAVRDRYHSHWMWRDIANCGMCRDCTCIIYSVEHDFREQEGRLRRVLSTIEVELGQSATPVAQVAATLSPPGQPWPVARLPTKGEAKKAWWKCFWFL